MIKLTLIVTLQKGWCFLMIKNKINQILIEINSTLELIKNKQESIKKLQSINLEKVNKNYLKFQERNSELDKTESSIKLLMENKFFKYIKHIDFLNEENIYSSKGFELIKELGCIIKEKANKQENPYIKKVISSNKKNLTFFYNEDAISNILEYSFYSLKKNIPIIPSNITIHYKTNSDSFYEPFFRFFNRNNSTSFINKFPFTPKQISKIIFEFDEEINDKNCLCKLYSSVYNLDSENSLILKIDNEHKLSAFNVSKKTEETIVPLKFSYSEDNIEYKDILFENGYDGIISLKNPSSFYLKVVSDNESIKTKDEKVLANTELHSSEITNEFGVYSPPAKINNINKITVKFPISSYNKIKKDITGISNIQLTDFLTEVNGVYILKSECIEYISNITEKITNLKYLDDISVLENDKDYFKIYVDTINRKIYCPNFFNNYNFFINFQYLTDAERIDNSYFTPILFSVSLKG